MNDYEKICKNLKDREKCCKACCKNENKYICAKRAVKEYVKDDRNLLLKLKGDIKQSDYWTYVTNLRSSFSLVITSLSFFVLCISLFYKENMVLFCYILASLLLVIFYSVALLRRIREYSCVNQWGGYVQVAIDEIDSEMKQSHKC